MISIKRIFMLIILALSSFVFGMDSALAGHKITYVYPHNDFAIFYYSFDEKVVSYVKYYPKGQQEKSLSIVADGFDDKNVHLLRNLNPGVTYEYEIVGVRFAGDKTSVTGEFTMNGEIVEEGGSEKTPPKPEPKPDPVTDFDIREIKMLSKSDTSTRLQWTASTYAQSWIEYGENTSSLNRTKGESSFKHATHKQTISNLKPGTKYYFRIIAKNKQGDQATTKFYNFATSSNSSSSGSSSSSSSSSGNPGVLSSGTLFDNDKYYGVGLSAESLANKRVGWLIDGKVAYRFKSTETGYFTGFRPWWKYQFGSKIGSYHGGDGGKIKITLREDDGSSKHLPSSKVIATTYHEPHLDKIGGKNSHFPTSFKRVNFGSPAKIQKGKRYHLVFENVASSSRTNYISMNMLYNRSQTVKKDKIQWRNYSNYDFGTSMSLNGGKFQELAYYTPILAIYMDKNGDKKDDTVQGNGYTNAWGAYDQQVIGGSKMSRQTIKPRSDKSLKKFYLRTVRKSGNGPLYVKLKEGSKILEQFSIPSSEISKETDTGHNGTWISRSFKNNITLKKGKQYYLEMSASSGTKYLTSPLRSGENKSFPKEITFYDGMAELSNNGGSSWEGWRYWSRTNRKEQDLQFYFELDGNNNDDNDDDGSQDDDTDIGSGGTFDISDISVKKEKGEWKIHFSTPQESQAVVQYGKTLPYGKKTKGENSYKWASHIQGLSGIDSGKKYYYKIYARHKNGDVATKLGTFTATSSSGGSSSTSSSSSSSSGGSDNGSTGGLKLNPTGCFNLPNSPQRKGSITQSDYNNWSPHGWSNNFREGEHIETITSPRKALRFEMIPNSVGTQRIGGRGPIPRGQRYRLQQTVLVEPGWEWVKGGKFGFGLGGGTGPTGGDKEPQGFTVRFGFNKINDKEGRISLYSYEATRPGKYGLGTYANPSKFRVKIGVPVTVTMDITMNSAKNKRDGVMTMYFNGEKAFTRTGIGFMTTADPEIDMVTQSVFYGGNTPEWAPKKPTHMQIYDVCWQKMN